MGVNVDCRRLNELLQQEVDAVNSLNKLLADEERAIAARDADAMERLGGEKQSLLNDLGTCHLEHAKLLEGAALSDDRNGLATAMQQCAGSAHDISTIWQQLQELLTQCQRQNQINGRLLASGQLSTQRALAVLLGVRSDEGELYHPDGRSAPTSKGLGKGIKV